jgi:hypothetical protein
VRRAISGSSPRAPRARRWTLSSMRHARSRPTARR